jgi:hypothetical protein
VKPHRTDRISLGFGLLFLCFVLVWLLGVQLHVTGETVAWLVAGGLIGFGAVGLMASLRPRRQSEPVSGGPASTNDW